MLIPMSVSKEIRSPCLMKKSQYSFRRSEMLCMSSTPMLRWALGYFEEFLGSLQVGVEKEEVSEGYGELGMVGKAVLDLPVELLEGGVVLTIVAPSPEPWPKLG